MAIEALTDRHVLEAVSECAFDGAADALEVRKRIVDLQTELYQMIFHKNNLWEVIVSFLPCANNPRVAEENRSKFYKRGVQLSNGMLECIGRLRETYQGFSKIEEEEEALKSIRWWRLAIFLLKPPISEKFISLLPRWLLMLVGLSEFIVRLVLGLLWSYFIFALRPLFLTIFIVFWILLFGLLFQIDGQVLSVPSDLSNFYAWLLFSFDWIRHSWITFVALQQGTWGDPKVLDLMSVNDYSRFWTLTAIEMSLAYLHLPVLITLLMQKFSRR